MNQPKIKMVFLIGTTDLIAWGGLFIIALLIYAETGFLLGLAIPGGETLVFTAGILVSSGTLDVSIVVLLIILITAGILGDISGYFIGKKFGKRLEQKKDTWYFKKKYFKIAEQYIYGHSKTALIAGKFLPVIRPFSPVISGMTAMPVSRFFSLSVIASILYMGTFTFAGFFLGNQFPIIKNYIGLLLPLSITIAIIIIVIQVKKFKKEEDVRVDK